MEPIGIVSGPLVAVAPLLPNETPSIFAVIIEAGFVTLPDVIGERELRRVHAGRQSAGESCELNGL